jgi:hypothetical protein
MKTWIMKANFTLLFLLALSSFALAQPNIQAPNAPDLTVVWQGDAMLMSVSNSDPTSNNFIESYEAVDPNITEGDPIWRFQGYMIYQVQIPFDVFDPHDPGMARLVVQTDISDDIDDLFNSAYDPFLGECAPILEVEGINGGLASEFTISSEMWAGEFVLGQFYCYVAVAYAANVNGMNANCPEEPYQFYSGTLNADGQMLIQCATVPEATGVEETRALSVDVFPNPTSGMLFLKTTQKVTDVRILSVLGEELMSLGGQQKTVDLSELPVGVYLIEITSDSQKIVQRLLKD